MSKIWTKLGARLQRLRTLPGHPLNWLFLPGGPGLGSESLAALTGMLDLPGTLWHLDLPGDGSNHTGDFSRWSEALVSAVSALDHVILVAHSTGGMYALATPALETRLTGLVLMDSSPDSSWQQIFGETVKHNPIPGMEDLQKLYAANPNNETLKQLTLLSAPYLFTGGSSLFLEFLPYNFRAMEWSAAHFDQTYKAAWIPKNTPTLILAGEEDVITPLSLFDQPEFQHPSILKRGIKHAGHFPWIDNPGEVQSVFEEYLKVLLSG